MKETGRLFGIRALRESRIACLSVTLVLPLFFIVFLLISRLPPSENSHETTTSMQRLLIVTVSVIVFTMIPVGIGFYILKRRAARLDEIFLPLGFSGRSFMLNGRQYYRKSTGREVSIWILKGPAIDIRAHVPVKGSMRIFLRDSIPVQTAGKLKKPPYLSNVPGLERLAFYPADIPWLENFLNGLRAAGAIRALMTEGAEWAVFRQVELYAGELCFHLYESRDVNSWPLDQQTVNRWITSLEDLADELQSAGLPGLNQSTAEYPGQSTPMLKMSFLRPSLLIYFFIFFTGLIFTILALFLAIKP
jgi:hypothetical protein